MDPNFWLERWQNNEIGFHASTVQPALVKHWPKLGLTKGSRVLVPLCGKSLDMVWLAQQGYTVVGSELSEVAINDFIREQDIPYVAVMEGGGFHYFGSAPYELYCGDFFKLDRMTIGPNAAYDRAALVAMPPEMQPKYAAKLAELMPAGAPVLLIGLDYDPAEMQGPPFNIPNARVRTLFEENFDVELIEARDGLTKSEHLKKRGVSRLEEATYFLRRRA